MATDTAPRRAPRHRLPRPAALARGSAAVASEGPGCRWPRAGGASRDVRGGGRGVLPAPSGRRALPRGTAEGGRPTLLAFSLSRSLSSSPPPSPPRPPGLTGPRDQTNRGGRAGGAANGSARR